MKNGYRKLAPIIASGIIGGLYGLVYGKGIFNKPRFKLQHEAVLRYIESRHKSAKYSNIEISGNGWSTIINDVDGNQYLLYMTRTQDGMFIFNESEIKK